MTAASHLLLVTLGPVQDFIVQARRTRDLWHGSHLLSELGRAAARELVDRGARLIFPAIEPGDAELAPCRSPLRVKSEQPPLNIANRLLAEVPAGVDPGAVARAARAAVNRYWRDAIAGPVKRDRAGLLARGVAAAWDEQVDTLLEFAAAWAPLVDYRDARRSVDRALAARKHLRDFGPWHHLLGDVPKSSLDGARETVLPPRSRDRNLPLARRYRIAAHEQLDAVGLVKRAGGEPEQFVPVVNVALASWLALAAREAPGQLEALKAACERLGLKRVRRRLPCAEPFPFDATILLRSRWRSVFDELGRAEEPVRWGLDHVQPLLDRFSVPSPYVACLVADGDCVGRVIQRLDSPGAHRAFSRALSRFAGEARRIVEQRHLGSLVYSGGDDVLAFVPLPEALACAGALRRCFVEVMSSACPGLREGERPTLSVGLGVGHVMESMTTLLEIGRSAEVLAKGGALASDLRRDALAVIVDRRSGGRRSWRSRWNEWAGDPASRLQADAALVAEQLSAGKVHEIERILARLPDPAGAGDPAWARVLVLEVRRSLGRAHAGERAVDLGAAGLGLDERAGYPAVHAEVSSWIARTLTARAFAAAMPRVRRGEEIAP